MTLNAGRPTCRVSRLPGDGTALQVARLRGHQSGSDSDALRIQLLLREDLHAALPRHAGVVPGGAGGLPLVERRQRPTVRLPAGQLFRGVCAHASTLNPVRCAAVRALVPRRLGAVGRLRASGRRPRLAVRRPADGRSVFLRRHLHLLAARALLALHRDVVAPRRPNPTRPLLAVRLARRLRLRLPRQLHVAQRRRLHQFPLHERRHRHRGLRLHGVHGSQCHHAVRRRTSRPRYRAEDWRTCEHAATGQRVRHAYTDAAAPATGKLLGVRHCQLFTHVPRSVPSELHRSVL